uniref:Uncharacterized protein n=1 Tax=Zea mays TaxID=4577 RepID=B4FLH7_MAIZE|nr:unknown [Zea mays]
MALLPPAFIALHFCLLEMELFSSQRTNNTMFLVSFFFPASLSARIYWLNCVLVNCYGTAKKREEDDGIRSEVLRFRCSHAFAADCLVLVKVL